MTPHTYVPDFTVRCYQEQVLSCRRPDVISSRHPRFMRIRKKKSAQKYAAEFCLRRATSGAPPRPHVLPSRPCPWRGNFRGSGRPSRRTLPPLPPAGELPAPGSMRPSGLAPPGSPALQGYSGAGPSFVQILQKVGPSPRRRRPPGHTSHESHCGVPTAGAVAPSRPQSHISPVVLRAHRDNRAGSPPPRVTRLSYRSEQR
jgi:hypothetical protein